jgi:hypothetical protein
MNADQELICHVQAARDALDAALKLLNSGAPSLKNPRPPNVKAAQPSASGPLDFTMPIRAFVKKYSSGLNGSKKFVLLLAYLSKGDVSKTVKLSDVESHWNKMKAKGLLGMKFNRLYSSEARENDWASTEKSGLYQLRPSWRTIFNG